MRIILMYGHENKETAKALIKILFNTTNAGI